MRKRTIYPAFLLCAAIAVGFGVTTIPAETAAAATGRLPDPPGWGKPTFYDDFTYKNPTTGKPAVDPKNWNVRSRSDLGILFDAAVPTTDSITVDTAGILHVKAAWLPKPEQRSAGQTGPRDLWHKTGYMDQRVIKSGDVSRANAYGRWEIRAKVPSGPKTYGALAAFWLRNQQSGEIDIMEAWGYNQAAAKGGQRINTATTTIHTQTSGTNNSRYIWHHSDFGAATPAWNDFHTYAFELTTDHAAVFVDGKQILAATPQSHPNLWNPKYFGTPLHMRLNLHVGPSAQYWGIPDPNHKDWTQNLDYQVDYVKYWVDPY